MGWLQTKYPEMFGIMLTDLLLKMKRKRKSEMEDIIEVKNVSKSFGGVKANIDISLKVKKGSITGLLDQMVAVKQLYLILL